MRIFLSYRRNDSAGSAGRIVDRLAPEFGPDNIFMDVNVIPLGVNFVKYLRDEVARCDVLLAVIGANWGDAADDSGGRKLENPNDFVRIEIAAALARRIPVVPVMIDGGRLPLPTSLPEDITELAQRHGLEVRHASFHADMAKLISGLREIEGLLPGNINLTIRQWVKEFREQNQRNPQIKELQGVFPNLAKTTAWRYCTAE